MASSATIERGWYERHRESSREERIIMRDEFVSECRSVAELKLKMERNFGPSEDNEIINVKANLINALTKLRGDELPDRRARPPRRRRGPRRARATHHATATNEAHWTNEPGTVYRIYLE